MNELIDLLKRWGELEPERCGFYSSLKPNPNQFKILVAPGHWWGFDAEDMDDGDLAYLQYAVQRAIVSHDLLFHLENSRNGVCYASVVDPIGSYSPGEDKEPAVALLRAYLAWLKQRAEVAAGGAT